MDASLRCLRGVEMSMKSSATYKISHLIIYCVPTIQVFLYEKHFLWSMMINELISLISVLVINRLIYRNSSVRYIPGWWGPLWFYFSTGTTSLTNDSLWLGLEANFPKITIANIRNESQRVVIHGSWLDDVHHYLPIPNEICQLIGQYLSLVTQT